jgi:hypothetical protein
MESKIESINKSKNELLLLIQAFDERLKVCLDKINENNKKHKEFIDFIELMKLYEIYKWSALKIEYKIIKKEVTKNKKYYKKITKNYGNLISYFDLSIIDNLNNQIKGLGQLNDDIFFNFIELKKKHHNVQNQCKYFIKNDQITKIDIITEEIKPLIQKIYENYIDILVINSKANSIKYIKTNILNDIKKLDLYKKIEK